MKKIKNYFINGIPNFTSEFINLKTTDIKKIISSLTLKVILYTFKNIWYFEDIKKLEELISLSKDLFYEETGIRIIQKLLLYLYSTNDIEIKNIKNTVSKLVSYKKGEEIMTTTAERLINEGLEQGIENEKIDAAKKMLIKGYLIQDIVDITELTVEEIQKIKNKG